MCHNFILWQNWAKNHWAFFLFSQKPRLTRILVQILDQILGLFGPNWAQIGSFLAKRVILGLTGSDFGPIFKMGQFSDPVRPILGLWAKMVFFGHFWPKWGVGTGFQSSFGALGVEMGHGFPVSTPIFGQSSLDWVIGGWRWDTPPRPPPTFLANLGLFLDLFWAKNGVGAGFPDSFGIWGVEMGHSIPVSHPTFGQSSLV